MILGIESQRLIVVERDVQSEQFDRAHREFATVDNQVVLIVDILDVIASP